MHCFKFKNRLALISLAVLASSSSLLAMDEMELDSAPPSARTRNKQRLQSIPEALTTEEGFSLPSAHTRSKKRVHSLSEEPIMGILASVEDILHGIPATPP